MEYVVEKEGKKILQDGEHKMRTHCKARKPDLTLENQRKKEVNVVDIDLRELFDGKTTTRINKE